MVERLPLSRGWPGLVDPAQHRALVDRHLTTHLRWLRIADAMTALKMGPEEPPLERALLDATLAALRSEGNVLIPTDTVGRVLELLLILDSYWCASEQAEARAWNRVCRRTASARRYALEPAALL